jgi:hypothetical protein
MSSVKPLVNWRPERPNCRSPYPKSEFQGNDTDNTNVILKARLEEIISISDVSIQRSNTANNHQNENNAPKLSHHLEH